MNDQGVMTGPARLEFVRVFPVTPEVLWAYLVQDEHRRKWLCGGDVEPRVGGVVVFDFDHRRLSSAPPPEQYADQNVVRLEGEVLVWEPPERLAFSWPGPDSETGTTVSMTLEAVAEGTELRLVHENLHVDDYRLGAAAGWHTHLDLLGDVLAGQSVRDFWTGYVETEAFYRQDFAGA